MVTLPQLWPLFGDKLKSLFSSYQLNAHFLCSITIYMLHYNPQHVSSSTLLIFRRTCLPKGSDFQPNLRNKQVPD